MHEKRRRIHSQQSVAAATASVYVKENTDAATLWKPLSLCVYVCYLSAPIIAPTASMICAECRRAAQVRKGRA